jgi:succinate-semialdehyde dehydrogenase/glutarate-semialdehyde dehydrogenase
VSETLKLYINGRWVGDKSNEKIAVIDPATEEILYDVYCATAENLDEAVTSAEKAFETWRLSSAEQRSQILDRAADTIVARQQAIAATLTKEQGKPFAEAMGELGATIQSFRWAAQAALKSAPIDYPDGPDHYAQQTDPEPVGVIAGFAPWNFPAMLTGRKIAYAVAAGCCIIIKPAEETPATGIALAQALHDADLPAGVLNMVFGKPAQISEHLINAKAVRKVSLTGSSAVGKALASLAANTLTPCVLELGGHAPVLVFDDVDVEETAKMLAGFKYRNAGQVCVSPSRFFIHENIADEFTDKFLKYTKSLNIGDGTNPATDVGPLAHDRRIADVEKLVHDAVDKGATCLTGGHRINRTGYFYAPTVLKDVPDNAEILKTEIFGPVAVINSFTDVEEAVVRANDVPYGLASYLFTQNQETIDYVKPLLEVGLVNINIATPISENVPFGGVKESGHGYEGGMIGLQSFQHFKLIHKG